MHRQLLEIQTTEIHWYPALASANEPCLGVTMPIVTGTIKTVINEMTHGNEFKLVNWWHTKNANLSQEGLNTSIDKLEIRWNIHLAFNDT